MKNSQRGTGCGGLIILILVFVCVCCAVNCQSLVERDIVEQKLAYMKVAKRLDKIQDAYQDAGKYHNFTFRPLYVAHAHGAPEFVDRQIIFRAVWVGFNEAYAEWEEALVADGPSVINMETVEKKRLLLLRLGGLLIRLDELGELLPDRQCRKHWKEFAKRLKKVRSRLT